jgi:membrane-bound ClpP family serine protease
VFIYIAILILIGIVLLVLEILILPGLIAGIVGSVFLMIAILWTFNVYGTTAGAYTALGTLLLTAISLYISFKSRVWSRFSLKDDLRESRTNVTDPASVSPGMEALTISALRPMGTVMVGDLKIEARTNGELIQENKKVVILHVLPSGVIVKEMK